MFVHKDLQGKVSLRYFWDPFDCKQAPFLSIPPAYPVRLPSLPTTRWQGMMILIGLWPTAPPIACVDMLDTFAGRFRRRAPCRLRLRHKVFCSISPIPQVGKAYPPDG